MTEPVRSLGRVVTLVLVRRDGSLVGALPPFTVEDPWWAHAEPVVQRAGERYGINVIILRLLRAPAAMPGNELTYLAEVEHDVPAEPWADDDRLLDDHPLRLPWARPGGPAADIGWAERLLVERGLRQVGRAEQVRTWNLSSLWRLPVAGQTVWFKTVPPFFEHEGRMLERLQGGPVPWLIAHEGRRMLLHEIRGVDLYQPTGPQLVRMVEQLVRIQEAWIGRVDELIDLGLPDWRAAGLTASIRAVIERVGAQLSLRDRRVLDRFGDSLDERFRQLAECGLLDTLVHGDFHPGNHRGQSEKVVLLDWGDSGVGHPLLDEPAFVERLSPPELAVVRERWHEAWRQAVPGSDPGRASPLLGPIAAARQAVIYQKFLDNIEPSEHPYHRNDPADWLRRTAALVD